MSSPAFAGAGQGLEANVVRAAVTGDGQSVDVVFP